MRRPNLVQGLRNAADLMKQQTGVDPVWLRDAANEIERMRKALDLQEGAEAAHMNCAECSGEEVPELCGMCFPLYDAARKARRAALASPLSSNK